MHACLGHLLRLVCNVQQGAGQPHTGQWLPQIRCTKLGGLWGPVFSALPLPPRDTLCSQTSSPPSAHASSHHSHSSLHCSASSSLSVDPLLHHALYHCVAQELQAVKTPLNTEVFWDSCRRSQGHMVQVQIVDACANEVLYAPARDVCEWVAGSACTRETQRSVLNCSSRRSSSCSV